MILIPKLSKGNNSTQIIGGYTVHVLCILIDYGLYL